MPRVLDPKKKYWYHNKMTDAQKQTFEKNIKLAYHCISQNIKKYGFLKYEDIYSSCLFGLIHASVCYDPNKGKFSTFAYLVMNSNMMMLLREFNRHKVCKPLSYYNQHLEGFAPDLENLDILNITESSWQIDKYPEIEKEYLADLFEHLEGRERLAIQLCYLSGYSQKEISQIMNLSQPHISRIINRGIKKMQKIHAIMMK